MVHTSYNKLTVKEFIDLAKIIHSNEVYSDKINSIVTHFAGDWTELPGYKLKYYQANAIKLFESKPSDKIKKYVWIKGKRYMGVTDATLLNTGQFTAVSTFAKGGMADVNIDKILGQIFYRAKIGKEAVYNDKDYKQIGEEMLSAKMGSVYGTVFFYSKVLKRFSPILSLMTMEATETMEKWVEEMKQESGMSSEKSMDGTTS